MTTNHHSARLVLLCIRCSFVRRLVSHLRRVAQLVQAFLDLMRLYQAGLQGNPNDQQEVQGAFHTLIIHGEKSLGLKRTWNSILFKHISGVRMPMVDIRKMRMAVACRLMLVGMGMGLIAIPVKVMAVLMVRIVAVFMRMGQRGVIMRMRMVFGQMQPNAGCHQRCCQPKYRAGGLAQQRDRQRRPDKWCRGKVGPGSCSTQAAKCQYK